MTLIAIATYGSDRAEIITDTTWYTRRASELGRCTKVLTIPHLDAAVITQGDSDFGVAAKIGALSASAQVSTFDELVETAPPWIKALWAEAPVQDGDLGTVFLVGYSDTDHKFRAWGFASDNDFEPFKILGLLTMPTPWTMRPSKLELERHKIACADHPHHEEIVRLWSAKPSAPAPRTTQEWIELAKAAQTQRAFSRDSADHVIVAGDVLNRPGSDGGSQSMEDESHGSTQEVPRRAA